MGRHIASKSFVDALVVTVRSFNSDRGNSQILREGQPIWEGLFTGDPNLFPYASERHWNDPRFSLIGLHTR